MISEETLRTPNRKVNRTFIRHLHWFLQELEVKEISNVACTDLKGLPKRLPEPRTQNYEGTLKKAFIDRRDTNIQGNQEEKRGSHETSQSVPGLLKLLQ